MQKKAFTLIELAIVLTIVGLIIGGSFQVIKSMRDKNNILEAKEQIEESKEAVMRYVLEWPNLPPKEEFDINLTAATNIDVPIFYAADPTLSALDSDICAYDTTNLSIVDNSDKHPRTIENVAFVVAHASANFNMQTALDTSTTPYEVNIYSPSTKVDDNTDSVNIVEQYDDIVKWVTLSELHQFVECSENKLTIMNNSALPRDVNGSTYVGAYIFADGGFPFADGGDADDDEDYDWCLEDAPSWLSLNTCNGTFSSVNNCKSATFSRCTAPFLDGVNSVAGTYKFKIYVKDSSSREETKSFTITIDAVEGGSSGGGLLPSGAACTADSQCESGRCKNNGTCQ